MKGNIKLAAIGLLALSACGALGSVTYHGWNYAIDAGNDGSGGDVFEDHGLAFKADSAFVYFALSTELAQTGHADSRALNDSLNQGDLFINFTGDNLRHASDFEQAGVYGVRFDSHNDSFSNHNGNHDQIGLYNELMVGSLTTQNRGYATYQAYLNAGFGRNNAAMGDLGSSANDVIPYLGNGEIDANILGGHRLGGITLLSRNTLQNLGLRFNHFGADPNNNYVYGFKISRTLLPDGDFTAHVFEECGNDGMAVEGSLAVPEPAGFIALAAGGLMLLRRRKR